MTTTMPPAALKSAGFGKALVCLATVSALLIVRSSPAHAAPQAVTVAGGNSQGSAANQLNSPRGVAVDGSGNVYVADSGNDRVQRWAPGATSGVTVAGGNGQGSAANQLNFPSGVAVDGSGNLYIADENNARVQRWAPGAASGVTVAGGNGQGSAANQLSGPSGVALDAGGNLYVADPGNDRVQRWAPGATSGVTVAGGNGQGSAANQLNLPLGVAVDGSGNVFVADLGNNRVQWWAPGAAAGVSIAGPFADFYVSLPYGVAVDGSGNVYIAEQGNLVLHVIDFRNPTESIRYQVRRWSPATGTALTVAGGRGRGSAATQLFEPHGVAVAGAFGDVYVADTGNNRVQLWAQVTPQYKAIAGLRVAGKPVGCVDVLWAASHALLDPVEVHWLFDLGVCDSGRQYMVMLAYGSAGQLTCADVQWNAAFGRLDYVQARNLLPYAHGCQLDIYANMVTLLYGPPFPGTGRVQGVLTCLDVNWHADRGLITPEQAGWLRPVLNAEGVPCLAAPT